jgi:hypothetical protein
VEGHVVSEIAPLRELVDPRHDTVLTRSAAARLLTCIKANVTPNRHLGIGVAYLGARS